MSSLRRQPVSSGVDIQVKNDSSRQLIIQLLYSLKVDTEHCERTINKIEVRMRNYRYERD